MADLDCCRLRPTGCGSCTPYKPTTELRAELLKFPGANVRMVRAVKIDTPAEKLTVTLRVRLETPR